MCCQIKIKITVYSTKSRTVIFYCLCSKKQMMISKAKFMNINTERTRLFSRYFYCKAKITYYTYKRGRHILICVVPCALILFIIQAKGHCYIACLHSPQPNTSRRCRIKQTALQKLKECVRVVYARRLRCCKKVCRFNGYECWFMVK